MAHRYGKTIKGQEIDDLHQEGVIKLYEVYTSARYIGKSPQELDYIFKKSLSNMLKDIYASTRKDSMLFVQIPIEELTDQYGYDAFLDVYLAYYKKSLSRNLSDDSLHLLDLLLEPTPAVYHMYNIQVMRRKALRMQGRDVHIPTKLTHQLIGSVLGFSLAKTKNLIRELQQAWKTECQIVKGKSKQSEAMS
jgi:DNA-binding Lrp family transcriptional regulator